VVLIDSNKNNIAKAQELGLEAISTDIYSNTLTDNIELNDVGYLIALTGNSGINKYAIDKFGAMFGENGSFRLVTREEMLDENNNPKEGLFSNTDDYNSLTEVAHKYPNIQEIIIKDAAHLKSLLEFTNTDKDVIPLFIKKEGREFHIISSQHTEMETVGKNWKLIYLGKPITLEDNTETV